MAVVSLDHLFLIIFSLDDDIFNPPRVLRRHKTHHHGRMKMCLSVSLSLSLSLSRRGKEEQTTQQKPSSHKKRDGRKKASRRTSSHSRSKKAHIRASCAAKRRRRGHTRTSFVSFTRSFTYKRDWTMWFLVSSFRVCLFLCVVSGKRERERESDDDV